jgi:membrane-bound metal-dependent hydrolase YbcI (DUF457 family)
VLFWHLGGTVAFIRYAFRDPRMDLRLLMLGAILPDLLDTPIGLWWWEELRNVRLLGHSLAFAAVVMVVVLLATRRGRPRKRWMPLAVGVLMHLVLDAMWAQPETLWWPFLGWELTTTSFATAGDYLRSLLSDWRVWAMEAGGLAYLMILATRSEIFAAAQWRAFVGSGVVSAPIGPDHSGR